ncbi:hypothetical protein ACVWXM_002794 [Bradyrhizobium sp. GM7.3]
MISSITSQWVTLPDAVGPAQAGARQPARPDIIGGEEHPAHEHDDRHREREQRDALVGVEHVARERMRGQGGGDDAEHHCERHQGRDVLRGGRLQQRLCRLLRIDMDLDMGADRIASGQFCGQDPRRDDGAADKDLVAFQLLAAGLISIADDGLGVVPIVRGMRRRLVDPGDRDDALHLVPAPRRHHPAPHADQIEQRQSKQQHGDAGGNLCPHQLLGVQHPIPLRFGDDRHWSRQTRFAFDAVRCPSTCQALLHQCRPGESHDPLPQRVIWRRLVVRYCLRWPPMDHPVWMAFARTTANVWHAP